MPEPEPKVSPNLSRWAAGMRPTPTRPLLTNLMPPMVAVLSASAGVKAVNRASATPSEAVRYGFFMGDPLVTKRAERPQRSSSGRRQDDATAPASNAIYGAKMIA